MIGILFEIIGHLEIMLEIKIEIYIYIYNVIYTYIIYKDSMDVKYNIELTLHWFEHSIKKYRIFKTIKVN